MIPSSLQVFLFNFFKVFFWNIQRFPYCNSCKPPPVGHPIRPKVRTAMDSMDSEEAEFLEPEQDEAKFAHDDAVCIYIYSFEPEVLCNKDVFF